MMRLGRLTWMAGALGVLVAAHWCRPALLFSAMPEDGRTAAQCVYFMCEYEKNNIDTIILDHARTCQTILFGEIHDNALEGMPAPVQDSIYVATLLDRLKQLGFTYLALEVNQGAPVGTHSNDMVRFHSSYKKGHPIQVDRFPHAKPGWIELARQAIDLDYRIRFIDVSQPDALGNLPRDRAMFETIKEGIFDAHPEARVIVYIGAFHVGKEETETGIFIGPRKKKPLGLFLDQYTRGNTFSVYMGHPYDTPVGCDLFISHFIWSTGQ